MQEFMVTHGLDNMARSIEFLKHSAESPLDKAILDAAISEIRSAKEVFLRAENLDDLKAEWNSLTSKNQTVFSYALQRAVKQAEDMERRRIEGQARVEAERLKAIREREAIRMQLTGKKDSGDLGALKVIKRFIHNGILQPGSRYDSTLGKIEQDMQEENR